MRKDSSTGLTVCPIFDSGKMPGNPGTAGGRLIKKGERRLRVA